MLSVPQHWPMYNLATTAETGVHGGILSLFTTMYMSVKSATLSGESGILSASLSSSLSSAWMTMVCADGEDELMATFKRLAEGVEGYKRDTWMTLNIIEYGHFLPCALWLSMST